MRRVGNVVKHPQCTGSPPMAREHEGVRGEMREGGMSIEPRWKTLL